MSLICMVLAAGRVYLGVALFCLLPETKGWNTLKGPPGKGPRGGVLQGHLLC